MTATQHSIDLTRIAAKAAADKLATQIVAYDVSDRLAITDVFLVVTASNERQVGAVVDAVEEELHKHNVKPVRREGDRENRWVLLDFLDLVVHVQHTEERQLYALERLWRDCPAIPLPGLEDTLVDPGRNGRVETNAEAGEPLVDPGRNGEPLVEGGGNGEPLVEGGRNGRVETNAEAEPA